MATQQVKFHSVTAAQYATATKGDGSLYFITDNGEIRKGASHITGTRVYTATDPTNGQTPVANLTILFNGSVPGANDKPKKGDILVVDQTLKAASGTEGQEDYVPAIVAKAAYVHNGTDWEACDGNVDASKVIMTSDINMAGAYTNVGNKNKGSNNATQSWATTGMSVKDMLEEIFTADQQPGTPTNPKFELSGSNGSGEVGTTYASQTYTGTWKDGSYTYGAWISDGSTQSATGTKVGTWTISAYNGKTAANATISGNTASITTDAYLIASTGDHILATFNVTNDTSNTLPAATNLKKKSSPEKKITQTSNQAQTRKVTGFRYWFYGSAVSGKAKAAAQNDYWETEESSSDATVQTNTNIRALTKGQSTTTINVVANADIVVLAIPSNKTLTKVTSANQFGSEITGNFTANVKTVNVGGGDSTSQSIGSYAAAYKVYIYYIDSPDATADVYTITVS